MKNYKVFLTILNFLQNPEKFYYIALINFHFSFCEWVDIFFGWSTRFWITWSCLKSCLFFDCWKVGGLYVTVMSFSLKDEWVWRTVLKREILTVWKGKFWQFGKGNFWQFEKGNFNILERHKIPRFNPATDPFLQQLINSKNNLINCRSPFSLKSHFKIF
jgi:hypothetical protein